MASKKPAKIASYEKVANTLIGSAVLYFGIMDRHFTCPSCNRSLSKGIIYEKDKNQACSRRCLETIIS
jgi:hypothetical protein